VVQGVHTPSKKVSAFAVVPSVDAGAAGRRQHWVTGGGAKLNTRTLAVAFFFIYVEDS